MDDRELDAMLEESLSQLPPDDTLVHDVTPWRRAWGRILWGIGLRSITLNFLGLNLLLPTLGSVLSFLGFRALRRENRAFGGCYVISIFHLIYSLVWRCLDATIWGSILSDSEAVVVMALAVGILGAVQYLLLWRGILAVQEKAGLERHAKSALAMAVFQILLLILGLLSTEGILAWIVLVVYCFTLRSLYKLSKEMVSVGYLLEPAPARISDRAIAWLVVGVLAVGITVGYLFFQRYPMEWQRQDSTQQAGLEEIRQDLLAQGFPEEILDDLAPEDLQALDGALEVVVSQHKHTVGSGQDVPVQSATGGYTDYGPRRLDITGIAVKLPTQRESWYIIQHFCWPHTPDWCGTEAFSLWAANSDGWHASGDVSGRLLCDIDGVTHTATYWSLGWQSYTTSNYFWGDSSQYNILGAFSLCPEGENNRGYVAYTIQEADDGWIVDEWINYAHAVNPWQYPVNTALDNIRSGQWNLGGAFRIVQDAIQFYPNDEDPQPFS